MALMVAVPVSGFPVSGEASRKKFWPRSRRIELRGLEKDATYEVYDYANRLPLGQVRGTEPYLRVSFKDHLLVRGRPVGPQRAGR